MVNYERPELVEVSDFVETVNLDSGSQVDGWDEVKVLWDHHNSGSYSLFHVYAKRKGKTGGVGQLKENIKLGIQYIGPYPIKAIYEENISKGEGGYSTASSGSVGSSWEVTFYNVITSNQEYDLEYKCKIEFEHSGDTCKAYYTTPEERDSHSNYDIKNKVFYVSIS